MTSRKSQGRRTGLLYLLMGVPAPFNLIYLTSHFVVRGDPSATASNIEAESMLYRLCSLAGLVSTIGFLVLVVQLHHLFEDVDRKIARMMVVLVVVSASLGLVG